MPPKRKTKEDTVSTTKKPKQILQSPQPPMPMPQTTPFLTKDPRFLASTTLLSTSTVNSVEKGVTILIGLLSSMEAAMPPPSTPNDNDSDVYLASRIELVPAYFELGRGLLRCVVVRSYDDDGTSTSTSTSTAKPLPSAPSDTSPRTNDEDLAISLEYLTTAFAILSTAQVQAQAQAQAHAHNPQYTEYISNAIPRTLSTIADVHMESGSYVNAADAYIQCVPLREAGVEIASNDNIDGDSSLELLRSTRLLADSLVGVVDALIECVASSDSDSAEALETSAGERAKRAAES